MLESQAWRRSAFLSCLCSQHPPPPHACPACCPPSHSFFDSSYPKGPRQPCYPWCLQLAASIFLIQAITSYTGIHLSPSLQHTDQRSAVRALFAERSSSPPPPLPGTPKKDDNETLGHREPRSPAQGNIAPRKELM